MEEFYKRAKEYCLLVENGKLNHENIDDYLKILTSLANLAVDLPNDDPSEEDFNITERQRPSIEIGFKNTYWEIFNPFKLEEPVATSLSDDLVDIYMDLMEGIDLYDCGRINDAIWQWDFSYRSHWGYHLYSAMRVLFYTKV